MKMKPVVPKMKKHEIDEDTADPFDNRNSMENFNELFGQSDDSHLKDFNVRT